MRTHLTAPPLLSRPGPKRKLIGLTPLIDVVFILLVFFMLASSFLNWRAIDLTAPVRAATGASVDGALLLEIRAEGLWLAGEAVTLDGPGRRLGTRLAAEPDRPVLIAPDAGVPLQRTVMVLDWLQAAGVDDMQLVRLPGGEE